jgi:hypothetical protein
VCSGAFVKITEQYEQRSYEGEWADLQQSLVEAREQVERGIEHVKRVGGDTMDLVGRPLVDAAITVLIGHLLLDQAAASEERAPLVRRFLRRGLPTLRRDVELVLDTDRSALEDYARLAGPPPDRGAGWGR